MHTNFDSLPLEVLAIILARLPAHQRLHHASLTSKRWRAAALRTITELTDPTDFERAAQLLPRLEHVCLKSYPTSMPSDAVPLPALRSISLDALPCGNHDEEAEKVARLRSLLARTTLTSVALTDYDGISHASACAASLTTWSVAMRDREEPALHVMELPFPRLTSLTITVLLERSDDVLRYKRRAPPNFAKHFYAIYRLLQHTHTQLESLELQLDNDDAIPLLLYADLITTLPLPRLARLTVGAGWCRNWPTVVAPLLAHCPSSVALSLHCKNAPEAEQIVPFLIAQAGAHPFIRATTFSYDNSDGSGNGTYLRGKPTPEVVLANMMRDLYVHGQDGSH